WFQPLTHTSFRDQHCFKCGAKVGKVLIPANIFPIFFSNFSFLGWKCGGNQQKGYLCVNYYANQWIHY
ncbi:MAG TPA: hypothetical protein H9814_08605, partial [Candidatus Bacteroides merdigallinarum]|nr:hypothetical protein [Candidatus Bacteroides merdigallinarum]